MLIETTLRLNFFQMQTYEVKNYQSNTRRIESRTRY